ncbi:MULTISPECIES: MgtC/SapB family protein [unclassified Polaromonas]|uniref:MgtC/SapB family protein n=1 Tax=unclassified Polaromonas TaxID=2638319 RepID=UPI000F07620E|nr:MULTISPECIES: MgtC/SapB family protein [unclassified Polaromonas]AYQ29590.1 MgtC/SapB family protein [Polaromonas sp. SP1]QGJ19295.1 MgtC/SapB family protein [Polaromonas sp. Pch-P]
MQALETISIPDLLDSLVSLSSAFVFGALIGFERQYRQRTAGLRTNVLVAVGAAIFVDMANRLTGASGAVHVVAYVVSGIGFLGAGVIMREEGNVRGLNTAATLWCSGAVGACAGADLVVQAGIATLFVLAANTLLRPIVNQINRLPLDVQSAEVTNTVYVVTSGAHQKEVLAILEKSLEALHYPTNDLEVYAFGEEGVKIQATLVAIAVDGAAMDRLVAQLGDLPMVSQAYWSASTTE